VVNIVDAIRERAIADPAHPALVSNGRVEKPPRANEVIDYAELVGSFDAIAKRLRAEGLAPGDRCGLHARPGRRFIELALGILAADGCLVPIPDDHTGAVFDSFARLAHLHRVVVAADGDFEHRTFDAVDPVDGAGDAVFRALEPAYLRFTSGTTSQRKGVILGHAAILERLAAANRALAISPADRILWLLPMAHHFVVSILLYLKNGATILLPASPLAREVLEFAQHEQPTLVYASPHHHKLLAKDASEIRLDSLRLAISTAEGLRAEIAEAFARRFGRPLAQALGIIEVGLPVVNLRCADVKPQSLGRPLPDYEVWLRGDDGRPVVGSGSPERTGEICIRGPGMLDAYLDPWLLRSEILAPDGFRTGDQGWFDADGDLHLVGRRASRICMAGMKFFGEEVEAVLDAHPKIRESRVFAVEHAHLGEIPCAEIVLVDAAQPAERAELVRHCRKRLPAYQVPREFRVVDALERTSSGKLQRRGSQRPEVSQ
jgi:long-chain acyl-CoA synthetase